MAVSAAAVATKGSKERVVLAAKSNVQARCARHSNPKGRTQPNPIKLSVASEEHEPLSISLSGEGNSQRACSRANKLKKAAYAAKVEARALACARDQRPAGTRGHFVPRGYVLEHMSALSCAVPSPRQSPVKVKEVCDLNGREPSVLMEAIFIKPIFYMPPSIYSKYLEPIDSKIHQCTLGCIVSISACATVKVVPRWHRIPSWQHTAVARQERKANRAKCAAAVLPALCSALAVLGCAIHEKGATMRALVVNGTVTHMQQHHEDASCSYRLVGAAATPKQHYPISSQCSLCAL